MIAAVAGAASGGLSGLGLAVAIAAAGGVGAAARLVVDGEIRARVPARFPVGTAVINVSGSLLLGLLVALVARGAASETWHLVLGTGLLGGFTTFGTASVDVVRLVRERGAGAAIAYGLGVWGAALLAAGLGYALGSL